MELVQGDHFFPVRSANHFFQKTGAGRSETGSDEVVVEEIHYDRPFDAKAFWPTYEPGVIVNDTIKKTSTKVPDPRAAATPKPEARSPVPADAGTAVPNRAEPPTPWTSVAGTSALGLGVVLVLTAIVLKVRGR